MEIQIPTTKLLLAILPDAHRKTLASIMDRMLANIGFRAFVQEHERSIAKELRNQRTVEDCLDVIAELELACLLAQHVAKIDYQVTLPSGSKRLDFLLHFSCGVTIGAEVKRIREPDSVSQLQGNTSFEIPYTQRESFKFTDRILESLSQLHSDWPNIVFMKISSTTHELSDASEALGSIVRRFRRGDDEFFTRKGFKSQEAFLEQYRKMSMLVVRPKYTPLRGREPKNYTRNRIYINPDARFTIPDDIVDILRNADIGT